MREAAAGVGSAKNLYRIATKFDEVDFAFGIDDESNTVRNAGLLHVHAILLRHVPIEEIAEQWEAQAEAFRERFLRRSVVGTDSKYFRAGLLELLHSSLECFHLGGSATGEGGGKEGEDDSALTDVKVPR